MSDEDDVVCFRKALDESKSNNAITLEDRVKQCSKNKECECMYCNYRKGASDMVIDFLAKDMLQFENNTGGKLCTYDLKDIFFKAILEIKKMEKEPVSEEE